MEKASDVYNKLKLRFVGKAEVAAKPKTEHKEPADDEETQNTGKKHSLTLDLASTCGLHYLHILFVFFHVSI